LSSIFQLVVAIDVVWLL